VKRHGEVTWSGRATDARPDTRYRLASPSPFFPLSTALWPSRPSHAQPILSFPHNSQVTEDFHRTLRRVWPCFQPKFCPRCGDRSRQQGQTRTRILSIVKSKAPGAVINEKDIVIPAGIFFLSTSTHSVANMQFRHIQNGVRTFTSLPSLSISLITTVMTLSRSTECDLARFWGLSMLCLRRHHCVSCAFAPNPQHWIYLLTMSITGHRQRDSKNTVTFRIYTTSSSALMRSTT